MEETFACVPAGLAQQGTETAGRFDWTHGHAGSPGLDLELVNHLLPHPLHLGKRPRHHITEAAVFVFRGFNQPLLPGMDRKVEQKSNSAR